MRLGVVANKAAPNEAVRERFLEFVPYSKLFGKRLSGTFPHDRRPVGRNQDLQRRLYLLDKTISSSKSDNLIGLQMPFGKKPIAREPDLFLRQRRIICSVEINVILGHDRSQLLEIKECIACLH